MASLKEIRGRIASVRGTLKITSAMRLISSAKLRSAQNALSGYLAYSEALEDIGCKLMRVPGLGDVAKSFAARREGGKVAVVVTSSNQSLCGAFNMSIIKEFEAAGYDKSNTVVYAIGRKAMLAIAKAGYHTEDLCSMADHPSYEASASLADSLCEAFLSGTYSRVEFIYSHYVSASNQKVIREEFLPQSPENVQESPSAGCYDEEIDYIVEPKSEAMLEKLLRQMLRMRFYAVALDAATSEHAARTLAMQIASDNAEDLLGELSLLHNKLRQQAITSEILDLVGGQSQ